jgi:hypothetical protein
MNADERRFNGKLFALALSLTVLFAASPEIGLRQPTRAAQELSEDAIERDIQQALGLLAQALASAKELSDPADRIRSYLAIAETLWELEPPRSRNLIRQAFDDVERVPREKKAIAAWRTPIVSARSPDWLRRDILRRAAALDPALATELANRLPEESESFQRAPDELLPANAGDPTTQTAESRQKTEGPPSNNSNASAERAERLLTLALDMVKDDPARAAALARESLTEGVAPNFVGVLLQLRQRHRELADELYQTALPIAVGQAQQNLSGLFLLGSYAVPGIPLPYRIGLGGDVLPVDPVLARHYLAMLTDVLTAPDQTANPSFCHQLLQQVEPFVTRYAPEKISLIEATLEALRIQLTQQGSSVPDPPLSGETRSPEQRIDDLVTQAGRSPSNEERDSLLVRAIDSAVTSKLSDCARTLVAQVRDLTLRRELSDYVAYTAVIHAADDNDIEAAKSLTATIKQPERMTLALIHIARQRQTDRDIATTVLSDAAQRIHRLQTSPEKARSLLRLAEALLPLNVTQAFDLLAASIPVFNATDAPIEVIEGVAFVFKTKRYTKAVRLDSLDLSSAIETVMKAVGEKDVNLAMLLSGQWKNPPLRVLAQVAAARGLLAAVNRSKPIRGSND